MTTPAPKTIEREKDKLWVTDAELIRAMGVPEKKGRQMLAALDKNPRMSGFPQKEKFYADRRYMPAVRAYFDKASGLTIDAGAARSAAENRDRTRLPRRHLAAAHTRSDDDGTTSH